MMMKILVFGARGWIGQQFCEIVRGHQIDLICGESRCDDEIAIRGEILGSGATHVISLIGRTHGKIGETVYSTIDYLEQPGKLVENVRDNLYSPLLLAEICKNMGVHYTYLGTGCIFTYDTLHNEVDGFREDDAPNFFGSSYSTVKGYTDRLMHLYGESVLNLRIRMPITGEYNPRNFITKITSYDRICSIANSMTVLPELLPMVVEMMRDRRVGTINLTNPGVISHNEILEMYREIVDPEFEWQNFSQEEQRAILASERSNNRLDTTLLETWFPAVHPIQVAVRKCLEDYKTTAVKKATVENNGGINLLITGGCGFIGSNFINYYFPKAHINTLVNFDAMYYCASEDNVDEIIRKNERYVLVKGNLCNSELVAKTLRKHRITHIIHFAAQSHVQNSFEDSIKFTHDNIVGTHTLLECGRKWGQLVKFVHVSTDEVYGESMNHVDEKHKTEHSILCPTNPYAATKAGAELIAQSYHHSYKMPIIITRGNNVYGPNQYPEKLIPLFIKLLKENRKVTIQGNGSSVRAFLHAYDTARAFECILERGEIGEIYNIGCDEGMEYSVMEIAHILIEMIHNTKDYESWIEYIEDRPYNDMRYYISNQKVKDLGWDIQVDLMTGIKNQVYAEHKIQHIPLLLMNKSDIDVTKIFGSWIHRVDELSEKFKNAEPFENIIIENFLTEEYVEKMHKEFPEIDSSWHKYCNPLEVKYAKDDIHKMDVNIKNLFYVLSTDKVINLFSQLTGISDLEYDPYLHGAGLHAHPRYGRLGMHLDYEKHPHMNKERRINIILYLSKEWKLEWGGETQLWDKHMEECRIKSQVVFNSAIIFKTNDISWHGLPEIITCPENITRKSFAYYYISPLTNGKSEDKYGNDGSGYRKKASFIKRPSDKYDGGMNELYKIRPLRLITSDDLVKYCPNWKMDDM